jgi:hypothetical protein
VDRRARVAARRHYDDRVQSMKTQLLAGEEIVKDGKANFLRGIEGVGGKLYLTNMRLIFEAHAFNVQSSSEVVSLQDIERLGLGWTKLFSVIPLAPNALNVYTADRQLDFTLYGRRKWLDAISQHLTNDRQG